MYASCIVLSSILDETDSTNGPEVVGRRCVSCSWPTKCYKLLGTTSDGVWGQGYLGSGDDALGLDAGDCLKDNLAVQVRVVGEAWLISVPVFWSNRAHEVTYSPSSGLLWGVDPGAQCRGPVAS